MVKKTLYSDAGSSYKGFISKGASPAALEKDNVLHQDDQPRTGLPNQLC